MFLAAILIYQWIPVVADRNSSSARRRASRYLNERLISKGGTS
jgi:hypothetical protein